ncbi:hypothetical protein METBIDRAFT_43791 [Metschnikowia bicuspidata var. bicuspidata NRRL YB-4993]|uniref:SUI1 domain-containing protein n=1 Tax=Metschnikowia bicuspidata var. bicuspidata NRRL YB-4993 TaxID=869754 RepID=A0A1A0H8I9_9ASCO|nr:hypothetical protein METBIDRAFT_43791 [Metschnikowia bicuspidata var. bicuspidata NRRL YB-4993]OBA20198.1 hypothetical protein METBIDRAFT_43791 [Metschnikowia bicuspidata var. bicuspidata NRRL YB-4993]
MFKKPPQVKSSSNVKSSERRHLLVEICKQFNIEKENLSKDQELALLPAVTKQATYHSIQDHKGTIFFDGDEKPTWFRIRDSRLYPTVYTLWRAGYLLPVILTNPFVISRIVGNANLLLPGCIPPFDKRALRGALVGIASYDSPTVIRAIGTCLLNLTQFDDVQDRQGTAVTIIHRIEDELFNLYEGEKAPESVDDAFPAAIKQEPETDETEISDIANQGPGIKDTDADPVNDLAEAVDELSAEDLDNFFIRSFVQSVKVNKIELPLSASKFMADYILKNLPKMDTKYANIKKTTWKKSAKFLKALEKMKYLTLKGKGDDVNIVSITVPPDILANFVTHKTIESLKSSSGAVNKKTSDKMLVVSLYKPTNKTRMVFNKLDLDYQKLYASHELKEIMNTYIKEAQLASKKNPKLVTLDSALSSATSTFDPEVSRDKLFPSFLKNFSPNYTILPPGGVLDASCVVKKGDPKKIKILTQTVLGRKKTTTVLDFEHFHIKPQVLAEELKNKCSGSTAIGPSKHNPAVLEVMVQGPHGNTIIEYLKDKGVLISFIDFEDKSKSKKKR